MPLVPIDTLPKPLEAARFPNTAMKNAQPRLSIVVPAFNEEERIGRTLDALADFGKSIPSSCEILIVDDGSVDETASTVRNSIEAYSCIRLIEIPHSGKAYATRTGISHAQGLYLLLADADLSTPPSEFVKLIRALEQGFDIAIGSRHGRRGAPLRRRIMSLGWHTLVAALVLQGFQDVQCGFKALRSETARQVLQRTVLYNEPVESQSVASVTVASDVEMLLVAQRLGYRIAEVSVEWTYRGNSKVNLVRDSVQGFYDLLKLYGHLMKGTYDYPASKLPSARRWAGHKE